MVIEHVTCQDSCCHVALSVAALERKISVRAPRDELVSKGILLESPTTPVPIIGEYIHTVCLQLH